MISPDIGPDRDAESGGPARVRDTARIWTVALIAISIAVVTALHLYTPVSQETVPLHLLYRRLYYFPILFAAYAFGRRGGVLAALAAAVPFALHVRLSPGGRIAPGLDDLMEIALFFVIGALVGSVRDEQEKRTADLGQVSAQLERAYKKLEERAMQLINIQDYTQSILRSITSGVVTVGPDGSVTTANPAAERMLGISEFDMVPKPIGAVFEDDGGLGRDVEKVLSGRVPKILLDTSVVVRKGQTLHVQATISRMRAVGGRTLGAVLTLEDVSEVRALTEQLIRADRLAAMGELTAGVAHEVRNPLGVIRASVQLLEDTECDEGRLHDASEVIKQEIDRLDRVIKALLDFGRPSPPRLVSVQVEDVLRDVVLFTRRFAGRVEVRLEERYAPGVPKILGDPEKLKQVFLNLVTNAVQAMEDTGGDISISTGVDRGFVTVTVDDNGPGIGEESLGKVFDPFYSTRAEGTGLGLTIVHRIVDEHDGHIELESRPGRGTTFTVSLPTDADETLTEGLV